MTNESQKTALFETVAVPKALFTMAAPTIVSQLITLVYNMADTWFIGRTNNPYMVAASSLVLTVFLMAGALANLFGVGGGSLMVRLLGKKEKEEAARVASWTVFMSAASAFVFSLLCLLFMDPLLRLLGASDHTIGYARQYLIFVVGIGGVANVTSGAMSFLLRNAGYAREAAFGLGMGGVLNMALDPLLMFVLLPDGCQVMGAGIATMLSNVASLFYFLWMFHRVRGESVLSVPRRLEKILPESRRNIFSIGVPTAMSVFLYDLTNIVINRLSASHGDLPLAAMGIVLKVERLPLNIGIGICLGMIPLIGYNYASGNRRRMSDFLLPPGWRGWRSRRSAWRCTMSLRTGWWDRSSRMRKRCAWALPFFGRGALRRPLCSSASTWSISCRRSTGGRNPSGWRPSVRSA